MATTTVSDFSIIDPTTGRLLCYDFFYERSAAADYLFKRRDTIARGVADGIVGGAVIEETVHPAKFLIAAPGGEEHIGFGARIVEVLPNGLLLVGVPTDRAASDVTWNIQRLSSCGEFRNETFEPYDTLEQAKDFALGYQSGLVYDSGI